MRYRAAVGIFTFVIVYFDLVENIAYNNFEIYGQVECRM